MPESDPTEPTEFYTWSSYINPDFADGEDPGRITVSQWGVEVDGTVIAMVNGAMCTFPLTEQPDSINFDENMADHLDGIKPTGTMRPVRFDPALARYTHTG